MKSRCWLHTHARARVVGVVRVQRTHPEPARARVVGVVRMQRTHPEPARSQRLEIIGFFAAKNPMKSRC